MGDTFYPNGLGSSSGDSLLTSSPLYIFTNAQVYWVKSGTGDDSNSGLERGQPKATLASAITDAGDDDIIVLMDGHAETLTSAQTVSERLTIVGEGQSGGKPTVKLTMNAASANMFTVTGTDVELRNIWFEEQSQANSGVLVSVQATRFKMIGCYVEMDENSNGAGISGNGSATAMTIKNTTFISTATSVTDPPQHAVLFTAACSDATLDGVTFDGGTVGWSDGFAYDEGSNAMTRLKATDISLLRGSDFRVNSSTTGYVQPGTATGSSRVVILIE